jgi:Zn-dependent M28 family amino/carboxypeptidase
MIGRTKKYSADPDKERAVEDWTGKLGVTGYDYSDLGPRFTRSGKAHGIDVVMDPHASGPFFMRSDNRALAAVGIPSHTLSVGYEDPWYHQANDHADTIDYRNMTNVVRAIAQAVFDLANDSVAPKWSDAPEAARYREAWQKLQGG